jgi:hypothetical protein
MKLGWIVNLLLLIGVIGLGTYAWHKGNQPKEPSYKLSALPTADVKKIEVAPRSAPEYALEKRGKTWFLTAPIEARADQTQVQRMLDLLAATSREKLAATDLKRFDLDPPALKVSIDGQAFSFGSTNPLSQDQYLATGDSVYLVSTYYASLVPSASDRMLTHSLFDESEKAVGFKFKDFSVEQKDGKWTLAPQPSADSERPSQDDLNRWADDWRYASSLVTQQWTGKPTPDSVHVKLADGKTIVFAVVRRAPELILARPDEKLQFQFSGEMTRRLLNPQPAKDKESAGTS